MTPRIIDDAEALDLQYEFYETPRPFTEWLVTVIERHERHPLSQSRLCEPCVGDGAIARVVPHQSLVTNDFDPRRAAYFHGDATNPLLWTDMSRAGAIDWTVTNTPFTETLPILKNALLFSARGVALHVRSTINEPLKTPGLGRSFLRANPPNMTLWLPRFAYRRSRTTGKWATDSATCCWLVWCVSMGNTQIVEYAPEWVINATQTIQKLRGK